MKYKILIILLLFFDQAISQPNLKNEIQRLEREYTNNNRNIAIIEALSKAYDGIQGMELNTILYANKGLEIDPNSEIFYRLKVSGLMKNGEFDEVFDCINRKMRQREKSSYFDLLKRGQCKYILGFTEMAIIDLEAAKSLNKLDNEVDFSLGLVRALDSNDINLRNRYIDLVYGKLEKNEDVFLDNKHLAFIYDVKRGQFDKQGNRYEAQRCLEKTLVYDEKNYEANILLGKREFMASNYFKALQHFKNVDLTSDQDKNASLLGYIAACSYILYAQSDPQRVKETLDEAIEAQTEFKLVYLFRAFINYNSNENELVVKDLVYAMDPYVTDDEDMIFHYTNEKNISTYVFSKFPKQITDKVNDELDDLYY